MRNGDMKENIRSKIEESETDFFAAVIRSGQSENIFAFVCISKEELPGATAFLYIASIDIVA